MVAISFALGVAIQPLHVGISASPVAYHQVHTILEWFIEVSKVARAVLVASSHHELAGALGEGNGVRAEAKLDLDMEWDQGVDGVPYARSIRFLVDLLCLQVALALAIALAVMPVLGVITLLGNGLESVGIGLHDVEIGAELS